MINRNYDERRKTMTNEQAATKLTNIMHDDHYAWHPSILEAFRMAVDALKGTGGDYISRKEAIDRIESHLRTGDELYPLTYANKVVNYGIEIAASCVYNMPSTQPERTCVNCGRTANNGGWYADGGTRCPIEEHYALPKDGYCHLWEERNVTDDDYPERRTDEE